MPYFDLLRPEHAYVFGLLQADGSRSSGTRERGKVTLELSARDARILTSVQEMVSCYSSISRRVRTTNFAEASETVVWAAFAADFRAGLTALGLPPGPKSAIARPPTSAFDPAGYLRGLVDGDGSVGFTSKGYPFLSFTTASRTPAAYFCAEVARVTRARRRVRRNNRDRIFNVMVASDPAACMARFVYPPECLAIERKRCAAAAVGARTRPPGMRARPTCRQQWTADHDEVLLASTDDDEVARLLGRTSRSVMMRRWRLKRAAADLG